MLSNPWRPLLMTHHGELILKLHSCLVFLWISIINADTHPWPLRLRGFLISSGTKSSRCIRWEVWRTNSAQRWRCALFSATKGAATDHKAQRLPYANRCLNTRNPIQLVEENCHHQGIHNCSKHSSVICLNAIHTCFRRRFPRQRLPPPMTRVPQFQGHELLISRHLFELFWYQFRHPTTG